MKKNLRDFLSLSSSPATNFSTAELQFVPQAGNKKKQIFASIVSMITILTISVASLNAQCPQFTQGITPVPVNDQVYTCLNSKVTITASQLTTNDQEPTGGSLQILSFTQPAFGTIVQSGSDLIFTPKSGFSGTVIFTYTVKKNDGYQLFNDHYYKFISTPSTWMDARNNAGSYNGRQGYLANITSSSENDFIKSNFTNTGWIGAGDIAAEGSWKWLDGPEEGNSLQYKPWMRNQPDNMGGAGTPTDVNRAGEHFASTTNGSWSDNNNQTLQGYFVEFGGLETGCVPSVTATATVTIIVSPAISLSVQSTNTCISGSTGAVSVFAAGGTAPYSYDYLNQSFGGSEIDMAMFETRNGDFSMSDGLRANNAPGIRQWDNSIRSRKAFADNGFLRAEASFKFDFEAVLMFGFANPLTAPVKATDMPIAFSFNQGTLGYSVNGVTANAGTYDDGVWYDFKIEKNGAAVNFYFKKSSAEYWNFIGNANSNATTTNYKIAAQYFDDNSPKRGFNSNDWKLSFNPSFNNLNAGNYNFRVMDVAGCSATDDVSVNETPFNINVTPTNASAYNACDGAVSISTGGNKIAFSSGEVYKANFSAFDPELYDVLNGNFSATADLRGERMWDNSAWANSITTKQTFTDKGYLRYDATVIFEADTKAFFGFTSANKTIQNYGDHLISFYFAAGKLYYYINGIPKEIGSYNSGPVYTLTIEKIGNQVKFYTRQASSHVKMVGIAFYNGSDNVFKTGAQYYGFTGNSGGFNTNGWKVSEMAPLTNLCPGNYNYQVVSEAGCTATATFSVYSPLVYTFDKTDADCYGYANGNITITANGGKLPYQYSIDNGATYKSTSTFNIVAGNYVIKVKDALGNVAATQNVSIAQPAEKKPTVAVGGPLEFCQGNSVTLTASEGASYLWSNGATTQSISAVSSNHYTVKVTDSEGCAAASVGVPVVVNPLPKAQVSPNGSVGICIGSSVNLVASGGVSYLWNTMATSSTINVAVAGTFSVKVTDSKGCFATSSIITTNINPLPIPVVTPNGSLEICDASALNLVASGGTKYLWNTGTTNATYAAKTAGNYTVTVTDANGCSATTSPVTIKVNPLPVVAVTPNGPTTFCQGETVTLSATNTSGFTYLWSNGATSQSITVNTSGNYTVKVTDRKGCETTSAPVIVKVNPLPVAAVSPNGNVQICKGSTKTLVATGGVSYLWNTGATSASLQVGTGGSYVVRVTDINGCSSSSAPVSVTINNLPNPSISPNGIAEICEASSINLVASGGATYLWNNGASTSTLTTKLAGSYSVTVTDLNSCSATSLPVLVKVNPIPVVTVAASGPLTFCQGGSVSLTASAGNAYQWSNGATTQKITVNTSGTYTVKVTDAKGCVGISAAVVVKVNALPVASTSPNGMVEICAGSTRNITASGGVSYLWSSNTTGNTIAATGGNYSVVVTDVNGCSSTSPVVQVITNALPVPEVTPNGSLGICAGSIITLNATGGTSYKWNTGSSAASLAVSAAGSYSVTVTNAKGCVATSAAVTTYMNALPVVSATTVGALSFCEGGSVSLKASNGAAYLWSNGETSQNIAAAQSGAYTVKVTDINGCSNTSNSIAVNVIPAPVATITTSFANPLCNDFTLTANSSTTENTFLWNNGSANKSVTLTMADADGNYTVSVKDNNGCTSLTPGNYYYDKQKMEGSYTIIGLSDVNLGTSTTIASGSVGVTAHDGKITLGKYATFAEQGAFAKAKRISVTTPVYVSNTIEKPAALTLPAMRNYAANTSGLSNYNAPQSGTITGNYKTLTIKKNSVLTVTGTLFQTVVIEDGATVNFTNANISIDKLTVGTSRATATSPYTSVRFAQGSAVMVKTSVTIYSRCIINPEENEMTFYLGDGSGDAENFVVNGSDTKVAATIYMPIGTLSVVGGTVTSTTMLGLFIAEKVESTGAKVVWQSRSCEVATVATPTAQTAEAIVAEKTIDKLSVTVMPNPSVTDFVLVVKSNSKEKAMIHIMDASGRAVENLSSVTPGSSVRVGGKLFDGSYYAQVIQGTQRVIVKLIKL